MPAGSVRRTLLFFCVTLTLHLTGQAGEIRLKDAFPVRGALITLGDMAVITGDDAAQVAALERLEMFTAPAEGDARAVSRSKIRELLLLHNVDLTAYALTGAEWVRVAPADAALAESGHSPAGRSAAAAYRPRTQRAPAGRSSEDIALAIAEYLGRATGDESLWEVRPELPADVQRQIPVRYDAIAVRGGQAPWVGVQRFTVEFQARSAVHPVAVQARVDRSHRLVTALRPLVRGEVLRASDVFLQPAARASDDGMHRIEDVVGMEVTRNIDSGQPIDPRSVRRPVIVKRRQLVTVYSRVGQVEVKTTAMAVQDGSLGDMVEVESIDHKARYPAVVSGPNVVQVYAGGATVSPNIQIEYR